MKLFICVLSCLMVSSSFAQEAQPVEGKLIWVQRKQDKKGTLQSGSSLSITLSVDDAIDQVLQKTTTDVNQSLVRDNARPGIMKAQPANDSKSEHKAAPVQISLNKSEQSPQHYQRVGYDVARFSGKINDYVSLRYVPANKSTEETYRNIMEKEAKEGIYAGPEVFDGYLRHKLINSSPEQRKQLLKEAGQLLSFERQIAFVAKLGGNAVINYDFEREKEGVRATKFIGCDEILSNLDNRNPLGVCRDISMCQAQVLEKMGNKNNVYMVAYATPGNYHVSVVASDPENPRIVHKISYDNKTVESELRGVSALSQDHQLPDVGIAYRIFKPNGQMVASLPTEMGLVLNKMTGGQNTRDFDPFIQEQYNVLSVGLDGKNANGNLFVGKLSNGDEIVGFTAYKDWNQYIAGDKDKGGLSHSGRIGGAVAGHTTQVIRADNPNREKTVDSSQLYMVGQEEVALDAKLGQNTKVGTYVRGRLAATAIYSNQDPVSELDPEFSGDADLTVDFGVRAETKVNNGKTKISAEARRQQTPGLKQISKLTDSDYSTPVNHDAYTIGVEHAHSEDMDILGQTTYVNRSYGSSASVDAGVRLKDGPNETILVGGYYAPVGSNAQGWQPGGADPGFSARIKRQINGRDMDASAGLTFFRGNSGIWYIGSEFGFRWK